MSRHSLAKVISTNAHGYLLYTKVCTMYVLRLRDNPVNTTVGVKYRSVKYFSKLLAILSKIKCVQTTDDLCAMSTI